MIGEPSHGDAGNPGVRVYLVRHGETEWSRSGQHTGRTDLPLTTHGEQQARLLRPVLQAVPFSRVFTSPARRARCTCALAGWAAVAETEPDLAEWDYGDYEGLRSADIRKNRPGWNVFRDGCPAGESAEQIAARADRLIGRLRLLSGNIALFSHGQFGCSLAVRWIGLSVTAGQHLQLDPASLGILGVSPNHPGLAVIARWNTTAAV